MGWTKTSDNCWRDSQGHSWTKINDSCWTNEKGQSMTKINNNCWASSTPEAEEWWNPLFDEDDNE